MINSANRGSGVSCYRVKTENNDSRATIRSDRSCVSRIMFRRLCDVGGKGEGKGGGAGGVVESRGSRFIVESFATMPRKTNRLFSNFVTRSRG